MIGKQVRSQRATDVTLRLLDDLFGDYPARDFGVRLWNGSHIAPAPGRSERFTLVLRHPGALRKMFLSPSELALAEAYLHDDFDVEGNFQLVFSLADYLLIEQEMSGLDRLRHARLLMQLPVDGSVSRSGTAKLSGVRHSLTRDRQAISYHYDRSNKFFGVFLDPELVYSCAYFATEDDDIETAQRRKLDYICRKLRLRPGERVLDIGCGWGALIRHAAQHYRVTALGVTLSARQAELAADRIEAAGLEGRCRVELCDYRELDEPEGFDKLVSVGMFEHVPEDVLQGYFRMAWQLLRPGGVFLNHGISRPVHQPQRRGPSFVQRYVFPDGEIVPIGTALLLAEDAGFEIRDVESLREHYVLTLRHWVRRLEAGHEAAAEAADELSYRVFRLYMSGSAHGFRTGRLNVHQTLLAKTYGGHADVPLTRADWYS